MLHEIQQRYTPAILTEALRRFGFAPAPLLELEGSAFVYEGQADGLPVALPAPSRSGSWVELLHRLSAGYQPHPPLCHTPDPPPLGSGRRCARVWEARMEFPSTNASRIREWAMTIRSHSSIRGLNSWTARPPNPATIDSGGKTPSGIGYSQSTNPAPGIC